MTKAEMQRRIDELEAQLKACRNTLAPFRPYSNCSDLWFVPCGKIEGVYGHPFEEWIRNAVCEQYEGETGWIKIETFGELPWETILCNVSYDQNDGTYVDRFCPLAKAKV